MSGYRRIAPAVYTLTFLLATLSSCTHHIEVNPLPSDQADSTILRAVQILVDAPALEGADHRPGVTLLEWSHDNVRQAIIHYATRRGTFSSVSTDQAELSLRIATKLALATRNGRYHYHIQLQAEISESGHLVKAYLTKGIAAGSLARWVSASDSEPTNSALQLALDELFTQIEKDGSLYAPDGPGIPHH